MFRFGLFTLEQYSSWGSRVDVVDGYGIKCLRVSPKMGLCYLLLLTLALEA